MPITYRILPDRRLVLARAEGILTEADAFGYQHEVWGRSDIAGFDEFMDMTNVGEIAIPSASRVRDLATVASEMDPVVGNAGRCAILAPQDLAYGLARMFAVHRTSRSKRVVEVFRKRDEALAYLGFDGQVDS